MFDEDDYEQDTRQSYNDIYDREAEEDQFLIDYWEEVDRLDDRLDDDFDTDFAQDRLDEATRLGDDLYY